MVFIDPTFLIAAGATVIVAAIDKTAQYYGVYWVSDLAKLALPLGGMILGVYFLENNPIMGWFK